MNTVLLAVKQTGSVVQTADGGIEYITKADLGGGGGGGGTSDATAANQVIGNAELALISKGTNGITYSKDTFTAAQNFTGATIGDNIMAVKAINNMTIPSTISYSGWYNDSTGLALSVTPIIGTQVTYVSTAATDTTKLATSAKQDTLIQSQSVDTDSQETLAIGNTSVYSTSGDAYNKVFLTAINADCWVMFGASGSNPTAARDDGILIPAGTVFYPIKLTAGNRQLAVINDVAGVTGKLNVVWSL